MLGYKDVPLAMNVRVYVGGQDVTHACVWVEEKQHRALLQFMLDGKPIGDGWRGCLKAVFEGDFEVELKQDCTNDEVLYQWEQYKAGKLESKHGAGN